MDMCAEFVQNNPDKAQDGTILCTSEYKPSRRLEAFHTLLRKNAGLHADSIRDSCASGNSTNKRLVNLSLPIDSLGIATDCFLINIRMINSYILNKKKLTILRFFCPSLNTLKVESMITKTTIPDGL